MKSVKIAELKDQLSKHLRAVERGGEVEVTDRDRPIARIVPIRDSRGPLLLRQPTRPFEEVRDRRYLSAGWRIDSTTLLLQERGDR